MANTSRFLLLAFMGALATCALAQEPSTCDGLHLGTGSSTVPVVQQRSLLLGDHLLPLDPLCMASPYSYAHLGIFCKAEVKMNKLFGVPVMIRLGDAERVEELEGKGVYRHLH